MKVVTVVGTRPQFVKAAAVTRAIRSFSKVNQVLINTDQHYDFNMAGSFFADLEIGEADYNLGIGSGTHGFQTGRMLESIETVLVKESPDWVLIYGDTNSTLAAVLAAVKLRIPTAHVEAGLRSFNRDLPEEINRVLTDHASDLLFAPTKTAVHHLEKEGISGAKVSLVGDVMYDVFLYFREKWRNQSNILQRLSLENKLYILATSHRPSNVDEPYRLRAIATSLCRIARDVPVVWPLHPRTRSALMRQGLYSAMSNSVTFIDPVGYLDMMMLEQGAGLIVTDSGGIQKEAFFHRVPCLTLRTETEWTELVKLKWNRLIDPVSAEMIENKIRDQLNAPLGNEGSPYGRGDAATNIIVKMYES